jgi:hypothetical protein
MGPYGRLEGVNIDFSVTFVLAVCGLVGLMLLLLGIKLGMYVGRLRAER